jgi:hypothetical protein
MARDQKTADNRLRPIADGSRSRPGIAISLVGGHTAWRAEDIRELIERLGRGRGP